MAIFFLNPDHDEEGPPFGCHLDELDALFSPTFELVDEQGDLPTFPGREGRELLRVLLSCESLLFPLDGARGESCHFRNGHLDEAGHGGDGSVRAF